MKTSPAAPADPTSPTPSHTLAVSAAGSVWAVISCPLWAAPPTAWGTPVRVVAVGPGALVVGTDVAGAASLPSAAGWSAAGVPVSLTGYSGRARRRRGRWVRLAGRRLRERHGGASQRRRGGHGRGSTCGRRAAGGRRQSRGGRRDRRRGNGGRLGNRSGLGRGSGGAEHALQESPDHGQLRASADLHLRLVSAGTSVRLGRGNTRSEDQYRPDCNSCAAHSESPMDTGPGT